MRSSWIVILATCVTGCATHRPVANVSPNMETPKPIVREAPAPRVVETRYDVRAYRDAEDSAVRHDAHAVYRTTRVASRVESLDTTPRTTFAPATYAPLPATAELSAELAAQRQITTELREIKARMAAIEQQAQSQYGKLVNQTTDSIKLRQQLEDERSRVRELEAKLRDNAAASKATEGVAATMATAETRW
jgi:hypothetical protein